MAAAAYKDFFEFVICLEKLMDGITCPASNLVQRLIILLYIKKIEKISKRSIKKMRADLSNCSHEHQSYSKSLQNVLKAARKARTLLTKLNEALSSDALLYKLASKKIESVLFDWDDLIEDLTLCADDEFRCLVNQLAQSL